MEKEKQANDFNNHNLEREIKKANSQINGADAAYKALDKKYEGMRSEFKVLQDSVNYIDKNRIAPLEVMLETHKTNIDGLQDMLEKFVMPLIADVKNLQEEMAELKGEERSNKRQKTSDEGDHEASS